MVISHRWWFVTLLPHKNVAHSIKEYNGYYEVVCARLARRVQSEIHEHGLRPQIPDVNEYKIGTRWFRFSFFPCTTITNLLMSKPAQPFLAWMSILWSMKKCHVSMAFSCDCMHFLGVFRNTPSAIYFGALSLVPHNAQHRDVPRIQFFFRSAFLLVRWCGRYNFRIFVVLMVELRCRTLNEIAFVTLDHSRWLLWCNASFFQCTQTSYLLVIGYLLVIKA